MGAGGLSPPRPLLSPLTLTTACISDTIFSVRFNFQDAGEQVFGWYGVSAKTFNSGEQVADTLSSLQRNICIYFILPPHDKILLLSLSFSTTKPALN